MKLPIKKEDFDAIKLGNKPFEWRDAHITFVCEETGETLRKSIVHVALVKLPKEIRDLDLFEDDRQIVFGLGD